MSKALWAAALAMPACAMAAAPTGPLRITTDVLAEARHTAPDGTTRIDLVAPRRVGPGDTVVVQLSYRNQSDQPVGDVVLANPVPRGLAFRAAMAGGPAPELSVDGRRFGPLSALGIRGAGGAMRAATPGDVTAVRWRLLAPIAPHGGGTLAFRAQVQ